MAHNPSPVRRAGNQLGVFSSKEISGLFSRGKLQADDEVCLPDGSWIPLGAYLKSAPATSPAGNAAAPTVAPRQAGYYVFFKGQRHGPLELSKIKAMVMANLLDSSATLESTATPGQVVSIDSVVHSVPPPLPIAAPAGFPAGKVAAARNIPPGPATIPVKAKVSYLSLWWKTTLWLYAIMAVLGYLSYNLPGLAYALGAGLILAPLKGAFWAWIIWLVRK